MEMMLKIRWTIFQGPNPIKTVNTKSLKQYKTLFEFHCISLYLNICNIKKNVIFVNTDTKRI